MSYKNFDQFFNEGAGVNPGERVSFTREWLKKNYRIVDANVSWVTQLSDVHDHDEQPLHFGQVKLASSFSAVTTQLVRVHNVWHIAFVRGSSQESVIVHPVSESLGAENEKNRSFIAQLAKTGTVPGAAEQPVYAVEYVPTQVSANELVSFLGDEKTVDEEAPVSSPVVDGKKTTSVSIDMSAFL